MTGLEPILAELAHAQKALAQSSTAFDTAMAGMRGVNDGLATIAEGLREASAEMRLTIDAIAAANHAQGAAIDAVIAATDAALRLVQAGGTQ